MEDYLETGFARVCRDDCYRAFPQTNIIEADLVPLSKDSRYCRALAWASMLFWGRVGFVKK